ncbi:MAG: DUF4433 domain-containing protein [Elusimicrobia bacterium]|nr:DUF4433 domain-containing protein [Elusimicrobiota bacterium]
MAFQIRELYYITHIDNLPSIVAEGILSHELVLSKGLRYTPVYDEQIIAGRRERTAGGRNLLSFANLYFQARNAMLYRVLYEKSPNDIVVLGISRDILRRPDIFISDGGLGSPQSSVLPPQEGLKNIDSLRKELDSEYWKPEDGSKRKMMAECLVPDLVPPDLINTIYVASHEAAEKVRSMSLPDRLAIVPQMPLFFEPTRKMSLANNLFLVEGDMFFSKLQTMTISVNCVGIMGKGLASRAKYQFSDVYVFYQDACRSGRLQMGKPCIYKRENSLDSELADEPRPVVNGNGVTWFLLFATKNHWKELGDFEGIKRGLVWLRENYKKEGIKSLAMPALGCGLGGLDWKDVGPAICRFLVDLDIPVWIYLPTERKIPDAQLTREFLLK